MSIVVRFSLPADQFPLGDLLEVRRGIRVRLESVIPTGDSVIPYFWVPLDDADAVEEALGASPLVETARVLDRSADEALFRVEWSAEVDGLVDVVETSGGVILDAEGTGDAWSFRMRFPDRADLSTFYRACVDKDLSIDLEEVSSPMSATEGGHTALTMAQREALRVALDAGYFDVPRRITLVELAERLDISDTALSQRIRRGLTTLLSSTLSDASAPPSVDDE